MRTAIALYKVDLVCAEKVREKPTGDDAGFITYSKQNSFLWLDKCGYLINKWIIFREHATSWFGTLVRTKKTSKVGKLV